jgi:glucose 1-dehydrogenase
MRLPANSIFESKAWQPHTVLVTGAGPIGLLAALIGAQRGLEVHIFDRDWTGPET